MNITNNIFLFAFNAKLSDGCDYATQTMSIVGASAKVFALLLGEPLTWRDIVYSRKQSSWIQRKYNSVLIRPFFIIPGQRLPWVKRANYFINAVIIRVILARVYPKKKKIFWFFEPWNVVPVFVALRGYTTIYDCVDYFAPLGYESRESELYLMRHASLMTCVSESLARKLQVHRGDIRIVPLGFARATLVPPRAAPVLLNKKLVVGYMGGINYRLDYPLLLRTIRAMPEVQFIFVGPIQRNLISHEEDLMSNIQLLFSYPNVKYVGEVSKARAMQYMTQFSVGIIPYSLKFDFNRFSYPMKLMEYFGFGLPVISTSLFELRRFVPLLRIIKNSFEFVASIKQLQRFPQPKYTVRARRAVARVNSWENKITAMSALIYELDADRSLV